MGFQERFLDQVGGIKADLKSLTNQGASQDAKIIAIKLQELASRGIVAVAGLLQEGFGQDLVIRHRRSHSITSCISPATIEGTVQTPNSARRCL